MKRELIFSAFLMNSVTHNAHGLWRHPDARNTNFNDLSFWVDLAQTLERGFFDTIFFADVVGTWDGYKGGWKAAAERAVQIPVNDPSMLVPAMAYATEHLGFAFTSSVIQEHPFNFARRVSTLDHLSRGRVSWNIVTNALGNAARNFGMDDVPPHSERYEWAAEYVDVVCKLWEDSWEDGAVLRDAASGIYADARKIHEINHVGRRYRVGGPHLTEPSPQRTPVLCQAGTSEAGRAFASKYAECVFVHAPTPEAAAKVIKDVRQRARSIGRKAADLVFLQDLSFVIGSTDAEAERKDAENRAYFDQEAVLAQMSGAYGVDFSTVDIDKPLRDFNTERSQGIIRSLIESAPDKEQTFRNIIGLQPTTQRIVGSPESIVNEIARWAAAGVNGINVGNIINPGSYHEFVEHVVPLLQQQGLMQRSYRQGTLREKLFPGHGSYLPASHPVRAASRSTSDSDVQTERVP